MSKFDINAHFCIKFSSFQCHFAFRLSAYHQFTLLQTRSNLGANVSSETTRPAAKDQSAVHLLAAARLANGTGGRRRRGRRPGAVDGSRLAALCSARHGFHGRRHLRIRHGRRRRLFRLVVRAAQHGHLRGRHCWSVFCKLVEKFERYVLQPLT